MPPPLTPLPIDPLLPEIVKTLRAHPSLVLEAPPGAGKTTRVPSALLDANVAGGKEIIVLQPRRLPTRLAAQRVSEERGEKIGEAIGYQVRFEDVTSPRTKVRFVTEGVLGRRLLSDPLLKDVGIVVLDEFHERHLASDIALAQLKLLQASSRKDLKLLVMSATLEAEPIAEYLGGAPRLRSEGRRFEVSTEYLESADDRPLHEQILSGIKRVVSAGRDGDILVFLPGAGEIRRTAELCEEYAQRQGMIVLPLHGDLPPAEQDRAVRPAKQRKLILSTNVAETSVTIDGVGVVIDSGLARVASHSPWSGLPVLRVSKVSKASTIQRAGRAGRTRAGHCLRLFTQHDFAGRPDHDAPEIRRMDLAETLLQLRSAGVKDFSTFPFFEPPPPSSMDAAETLLRRLHAVDSSGAVTELGRRLLRFPVHPRQARVIVEGERRGVATDAVLAAAVLGERDIRSESRVQLGRGAAASSRTVAGPSDVLEILERFRMAEKVDFARDRLRGLGLEANATLGVDRVRKQLSRGVDRNKPAPASPEAREQAIGLAVLAGYPDRVARRRKPRAPELLLFEGGQATLSDTSVVQEAEWLVAVDAEERGHGRNSGVLVRIASQIEPEWLLELFGDELTDVDALEWNEQQERVDRVTRLSFGPLVLEEKRQPAPPSDGAAKLLAEKALAAGIEKFADKEAVDGFAVRVELLGKAFPEAKFPAIDSAYLQGVLTQLAQTARSFSELREAGLGHALSAQLDSTQQRLLAREVPDKLTLPGGRTVKIHYEAGKPPWIESRLQDFFGQTSTPKVCGGRIPLTLHLLAPNQRPVQVTNDLDGFWDRHYPAIRKELSRRYPRHPWPDDPRSARPPAPRR
ncbi:MAG: ATP-dependent helicase HrpB [Myxococcaceae bacterium]